MSLVLKRKAALGLGGAVALATLGVAIPGYATAAGGPFAGLSGSWSGGGVISMADGSQERIHCRAHYSAGAGGRSLSQNMHCASASSSLQISAFVVDQDGVLSGTWSEASHGVSGSISGRVSGSTIRAYVSGGSFNAGVGIDLRGDSHSVTITPSSNVDIRSVSVSMRRG
ncbi:MAG TPA: hypothetical protein VK446_12150 [Methylocystis sp.]|nr:hypothetical protein [Methylocystis sp.]